MQNNKHKRLPIWLTIILRKICVFLFAIGYALLFIYIINDAITLIPHGIKLRLLFKIIVILVVGVFCALLPVLLIYPYAKLEEFLIEKVIPKKIKIFFNIDKIEESYTPKEKTK